jgi:hypothetical protein
VVWEQKRAKVHVVSAEKIDQERAPPSERKTYVDREENLRRGEGQLLQDETLRNGGQKQVGNGCSGKMVVGVQVEVGWEGTGKNFVVVIGVVFGDEVSLERDVSAANRRARVEDRD